MKILPLKIQLKFHNPIGTLTSTVKRKLIINHKFKPVNHEDYLFWAELNKIKENIKIEHINEYLAVYNKSTDSLSANKIKSLRWHFICYLLLGYKIGLSRKADPKSISYYFRLFSKKITGEKVKYDFFDFYIKEFGIEIPDDAAENIQSFGDAVKFIEDAS